MFPQTALSQYRNFLFIAYRDQIHVFAPRYPEQTLSEKPELIIDLPTSRRGLPGYIEHECPHAVNHLIVADLGKEEILVVACDDGDVISYMTRSIGLVIDQSIPLRKPWFSQNVGASAWGLAVHTQACLLAVSSNSHRIEVFAPSLWHHESCDQMLDKCRPQCEDYVESQLCSCDGHWMQMLSDMPGHRLNSWKFSLSAHFSNVPNLAFCNSDLDREGRFLVSTDIENNTFVWDIYLGHVVHEIEESLPSK